LFSKKRTPVSCVRSLGAAVRGVAETKPEINGCSYTRRQPHKPEVQAEKHGKTEAADIGYRLKDIYSFCSKWYREGETRKSDGFFYFRDGIAAFKRRMTGVPLQYIYARQKLWQEPFLLINKRDFRWSEWSTRPIEYNRLCTHTCNAHQFLNTRLSYVAPATKKQSQKSTVKSTT
jgi:hypothetical protein